MTQNQLQYYEDWYDKYFKSFLTKDSKFSENLLIKYQHSKNVQARISELAETLNFSKGDRILAEFIGLYHDVGRYIQYRDYQTFSDSKSQNHAELGVSVINGENTFNKLDEKERKIICISIKNHSIALLPEDLTNRELLFSKLIRDADKLDIWRLVTEYYYNSKPGDNKTIELELPNETRVSDKVANAIRNHQIVLKEDMETLNDFKLLQVGWIFDLNFDYSCHYVIRKGYIDQILDSMKDGNEVNEIKHLIREYLNRHLIEFHDNFNKE